MSRERRFAPSKLPSIGFVLVALVHLGLVGFLVWGFEQPPLDRVWELGHALKLGKLETLTPRDKNLLRATLERHPGLAESLLTQGKVGIISAHDRGRLETAAATVLRSADATLPCNMQVEARSAEQSSKVHVEVSGSGWQRRLLLSRTGSVEVAFPSIRPAADIIEVRFTRGDSAVDARTAGVHLGFRCGGKAGHE